jgi:hypothetical protein
MKCIVDASGMIRRRSCGEAKEGALGPNLRRESFVSGHEFTRAANAFLSTPGFSPCVSRRHGIAFSASLGFVRGREVLGDRIVEREGARNRNLITEDWFKKMKAGSKQGG